MLCRLHTAAIAGIDAQPVEVEVDISSGLPGFHLVGLPDGAVREGSVRIRAAIANSGFDLGPARVTVNLAPADLRKDGTAFDLPIALGGLVAKGLAEFDSSDCMIAGELALDARVRSIRGALSITQAARDRGMSRVMLPLANASEAALVDGIDVIGVASLKEAVAYLCGASPIEPALPTDEWATISTSVDFSEVCGQEAARRAAEVAAAGGHNLMLVGPPGTGKTMIASRIGTILPLMTRDEAIETTKIHSVAGLLTQCCLMSERPFRAPHHTCSSAGLVGGGSNPRPGEVSLAHNGVLFLDELPEFQRNALEVLRQPLEMGRVTIVRARQAATFPSRFMLVAAMNPCPCGYHGSKIRTCTCGEREAVRYANRISGPLLDRFDLFVRVEPVSADKIIHQKRGESSEKMAERVRQARAIQAKRFVRTRTRCNAQISTRNLWKHCQLTDSALRLLESYGVARQLSARALHRGCRVARTVADLEGSTSVTEAHLAVALSMQRDRWIS